MLCVVRAAARRCGAAPRARRLRSAPCGGRAGAACSAPRRRRRLETKRPANEWDGPARPFLLTPSGPAGRRRQRRPPAFPAVAARGGEWPRSGTGKGQGAPAPRLSPPRCPPPPALCLRGPGACGPRPRVPGSGAPRPARERPRDSGGRAGRGRAAGRKRGVGRRCGLHCLRGPGRGLRQAGLRRGAPLSGDPQGHATPPVQPGVPAEPSALCGPAGSAAPLPPGPALWEAARAGPRRGWEAPGPCGRRRPRPRWPRGGGSPCGSAERGPGCTGGPGGPESVSPIHEGTREVTSAAA